MVLRGLAERDAPERRRHRAAIDAPVRPRDSPRDGHDADGVAARGADERAPAALQRVNRKACDGSYGNGLRTVMVAAAAPSTNLPLNVSVSVPTTTVCGGGGSKGGDNVRVPGRADAGADAPQRHVRCGARHNRKCVGVVSNGYDRL